MNLLRGIFLPAALTAPLLAPSALLVVGGGCTSALESGHNTALDGMDLQQMTDQMAASLAADPEVKEAIGREGALKVVVQPVENLMTGEVLPPGQADAFTARVRSLLSRHAPGQFTWIMNRDAYYRLRRTELGNDLGPAPEAINPRYRLTATFRSLTDESSKRRSSAYLCTYRLTDLDERTILWTDKYEVKKVATKAFLD